MRNSILRISLTAAAAVALTAGTAAIASADEAAGPTWRISYSAPTRMSSFGDAVALSSRDVWAVGDVALSTGGTRPFIRQWNGRSWTIKRLPSRYGSAQLFAVAASSARNAWVFGGYRDSAMHSHVFALQWHGSWSQRGTWPSNDQQIDSAVVLSPRDVWTFGSLGTWHFNGSRWRSFVLPFELHRASAISATDIWAVGVDPATRAPVVARWHAGRWRTHPVAPIASGPPGPQFDGILARSDRDVWVVGGTVTSTGTPKPLVLHWSSGKWRQVSLAQPGNLSDVTPDGSGGLWASFLGPYGAATVAHYSAGHWRVVSLPRVPGRSTSTSALARVPRSKTVFLAGLSLWGHLPNTAGLILKFAG